ncbi:MAG: metallo-mystery pair system four-Cys motif protein [Acidobacteria bacterium]|nr:metallo-mystery pair system four-Cys motif protein [Acidobacteriota bacterium]
MKQIWMALPLLVVSSAWADDAVTIRFRAVVGNEDYACGKSYTGIGTSKSTITPRDFRFYVHNVRLIDSTGKEVPVQLKQDEKWQIDNLALLDFENATGGCGNGTPDTNHQIVGTVPASGNFKGIRFTVGVPFEKNHTDLTTAPSPLNLTALAWVWNAGRKFARLDFSSTGAPRGYAIHLGSTGCTPDDTKTTIPTKCGAPNRPEVEILGFNPLKDFVVADMAALLKDSNVDAAGKMMSGCMSGPETPACKPLFANLGLAIGDQAAQTQTFFRGNTTQLTQAQR